MNTENFSTRILPYLNILGNYDKSVVKAIEKELIEILEENGTGESRYRRFKTDKRNRYPLYHLEAEVIFQFFKKKFEEKIRVTSNEQEVADLERAMPQSTLDIYYTQPLKMSA